MESVVRRGLRRIKGQPEQDRGGIQHAKTLQLLEAVTADA